MLSGASRAIECVSSQLGFEHYCTENPTPMNRKKQLIEDGDWSHRLQRKQSRANV